MERSILLIKIIDFLGSSIKAVHGNPTDIEIKYLKDPQSVDEFTLDWVNPRQPAQQKIAESSIAKAIVVSPHIEFTQSLKDNGKVLLVVENPKLTIAKVGNEFFVTRPAANIHTSAVIHPEAKLGKDIFIGANSIIGKCKIGNIATIYQNVVINDDVEIGDGVIIKPGAVLGFDGFGYEREKNGQLIKFPQLGKLIIHDQVDIGSNTVIDKGSLANTIIGHGTKINNLCHIAHNVVIGKNVVITAHVNISGSSIIEDNVWIAPNSSLRGHQKIGQGTTIGMGAVVTKDVPEGETWVGNPAKKLIR
jgi:UDP-3-O-[3-hydroxymyristoyl] glucosamine N-acyltransferase